MDKYTGEWNELQLKHLLRRTLFGVPVEDYDFFVGKSMEECVEIILTPKSLPPLPVFPAKEEPELSAGSTFVFAAENKARETTRLHFLKAWWTGVLLDPKRSITEKMVFFWRNHFSVEFTNVNDTRYDYRYLTLIRQQATGNFKKLLKDITTDPCMLVYLNGNLNGKAAINENYGRELQELFSIGKGPDSHYTEMDVKAAAKVLTGWKDDKEKISFYFDPLMHNNDDKIFSAFYKNHLIKGRDGLDGAMETDDLISMICDTSESSKFICRKLYRWFVHSHIDSDVEISVIEPLSRIMTNSNYEILPVLKMLLTSQWFYKSDLVGGMVKSPIDFLCGILHAFRLEFAKDTDTVYDEWDKIAQAFRIMGEDITDPPGVAGWPAYYEFPIYDKNWINSEGIAMRNKVIKFFSNPLDSQQPFFKLNFRAFIERLNNPGSTTLLLSDSLKLLCVVKPGSKKVEFLQSILEKPTKVGMPWAELWTAYKSSPDKNEIKDEIDNRLMNTFGIILSLPEYQIM